MSPSVKAAWRASWSVCLSAVIVSCGGGTPSPSSPPVIGAEVINGVTVPAAPIADANATLLGMDSNRNGVRDDAERVLGAKFGASGNAALLDLAKAYQGLLVLTTTDGAVLTQQLTLIRSKEECLSADLKARDAATWVRLSTINSTARLQAYAARTSAAGVVATLQTCGR